MDKFKQLQDLITSAEADAKKFYEGANSAAGTRIRKAMQDIKTLTSEMRKEVTEMKSKK